MTKPTYTDTVTRILAGGALILVGSRAMEAGFDLLTRPDPARVVKAAEDATKAAADVPPPFTAQEGTS